MIPPDETPPAYELRPIDRALGQHLGVAIAAIEPWSVVNWPASHLIAFLTRDDPGLTRYAVMVDGAPAGAICVRWPWLRGPYLQLIALLPPFQGLGLGGRLLNWFEQQGAPGDRWLWLCCSTFNTRAAAFYEAHGYQRVATLTDVLQDGMHEFLMRKRKCEIATGG